MNGFLYNLITADKTDLSATLFAVVVLLAVTLAVMLLFAIGLAIKIIVNGLIIKYKIK